MTLVRIILFSLSCGVGCGTGVAVGESDLPLVYGTDDRVDVFAHPSVPLRQLATKATLALITRANVDTRPEDVVQLLAQPLGEREALCPDEPFFEQPTASACSAVLIERDLVLTAGHCVTSEEMCRGLRYVFKYHYVAPGQLARITEEEVFGCRRLLLHRSDPVDAVPRLDYAILQLDRPVPETVGEPARPSEHALVDGARVVAIGNGSGLPTKIDDGAVVIDARTDDQDFFFATTDTFAGSSGAGVFDEHLELVGLVSRGAADFDFADGCFRAHREPIDGRGGKAESITYAHHAVRALCEGGWPSSLCGRSTTCGDGFCTGDETHVTCDADCEPVACGNALCEAGEIDGCPADCGRSLATVPESWRCDLDYFDAQDGCDCDCGAIDPDCASLNHCEPPSMDEPPALGCRATGPARRGSGGALLGLMLVFVSLRRLIATDTI